MNQISTAKSAAKRSAGQMLESILNSIVHTHGPQRMLLLDAGEGSLPGIDAGDVGLTVRASVSESSKGQDIQCDTNELPFANESFSLIVIHDMVHSGNEDVIEEAKRVLGSSGLLVLLGRGRFGKGKTTSLMPFTVCRKLRELGFVIEKRTGFGVWGRAVHLNKQWQNVILPVSDQILISGKLKRNRPVVTHLRFSQPQTAGARSTPMDALTREAV
jgi:SAM-dependent methyltransferase